MAAVQKSPLKEEFLRRGSPKSQGLLVTVLHKTGAQSKMTFQTSYINILHSSHLPAGPPRSKLGRQNFPGRLDGAQRHRRGSTDSPSLGSRSLYLWEHNDYSVGPLHWDELQLVSVEGSSKRRQAFSYMHKQETGTYQTPAFRAFALRKIGQQSRKAGCASVHECVGKHWADTLRTSTNLE